MPPIELLDRSAILANAAASLPAWRARLPKQRPRLFFTVETWANLRSRYAASTGRERAHFDAALKAAHNLAAEPAIVYQSREEMMRTEPGLTLLDAEQELWMRPLADGIVALSFALALEANSAIREKLRETVLAMCAFPSWGPNNDLAAGHTGRAVAIAYDWHPEIWSGEEKNFIREVICLRMNQITSAAYGGTFWAGHYDENHDHVSVCGVGLCGLAFLDEIPDAAEWTALALANFDLVAQVSSADGTSAEGVPYWSYGTSFIFQYIEATRHILDTAALYAAPAFRNSIAARLHSSTPDLAGTVAWGDSPPRDYYGPHHLLFRLAAEYNDGAGQFLGENLPFEPGGFTDVLAWTALWYDPSIESRAPNILDRHAKVGGLINTRSGWETSDYLLAFKAGFTNRNHSHLDAGALAFCIGSEWLLTTPGYGLGKGNPDFWDKASGRWTYQSNATEGQSTMLIGGRNQRFDFEARGTIDRFESTADFCRISAELTGAYDNVTSVRRSIFHRRNAYILILDEIETPQPATVEWLAQVPPNSELLGEKLRIRGATGSLDIVAISPVLNFALRQPTSSILDVLADRVKTCALMQEGTSLRFAVALIPNDYAPLDFSPNGSEILVTGRDWTDRVSYTS